MSQSWPFLCNQSDKVNLLTGDRADNAAWDFSAVEELCPGREVRAHWIFGRLANMFLYLQFFLKEETWGNIQRFTEYVFFFFFRFAQTLFGPV